MKVERLALNYDQVEKYNPPPNPTKLTDSRASGYVEEYGASCWELDALEPMVISKLVKTAILKLRDADLWAESIEKEDIVKEKFAEFRRELEEE